MTDQHPITPVGESLKEAMRPKSTKEQALHDLHAAYNADQIDDLTYQNILCALGQLDG